MKNLSRYDRASEKLNDWKSDVAEQESAIRTKKRHRIWAWPFIPGNNKQYWKWKQYAHMGVDSCISSHHRHYLHRARPWAHISAVCTLYTKRQNRHRHTHKTNHLLISSSDIGFFTHTLLRRVCVCVIFFSFEFLHFLLYRRIVIFVLFI